jgi:hypothetical protein
MEQPVPVTALLIKEKIRSAHPTVEIRAYRLPLTNVQVLDIAMIDNAFYVCIRSDSVIIVTPVRVCFEGPGYIAAAITHLLRIMQK